MDELFAELANYQNAIIMALTWAIIEFTTPLAEWVVTLPSVKTHRVLLYELQKHGKKTAATLWCSVFVWVPYAQPVLCDGPQIEGCQTVFNRIAIGIILGVSLSLGHWGGAIAMRRLFGREKVDKKDKLTNVD